MAWVLWDILIPLMASFALGVLLLWLLTGVSRKRGRAAEVTVARDPIITTDAGGQDGKWSLQTLP